MIKVALTRSSFSSVYFTEPARNDELTQPSDSVPGARRSTSWALLEVPVRPEIDGLNQGVDPYGLLAQTENISGSRGIPGGNSYTLPSALFLSTGDC
jgi:hypothetical protein